MEAKRLNDLLERYLQKTATASEREELFAIARASEADDLEEAATQINFSGIPSMHLSQDVSHEILQAILFAHSDTGVFISEDNDSIQRPVHRIHFLKTSWFRYAAAIIIMITGAAIWYAQYNHSKSFNPLNPSSRQVATIPPGRDRAILTLANGQQIILDSTQGNVVKKGNLTVVNLAGKLKYEGIGTATEYNIISTPKGGQYQIVLPDGSKVWLNAASSIKFPTAFASDERNVEMTGEAYMEIAKNPKQPFSVHVNGVKIAVLGTSFNVNAYSDETTIKTTLITGSVKVISNAKEAILKPSQQALINPANQNHGNNLKIPEILIQTADTEQTLAWKNGVFQFNYTSLAEAMRQLARWYNVEVVYEKGVSDIKLEGKMKRDLTLSQVLDILGELGVKFRIEGKRLIVM